MARVICNRPNASTEINGIRFHPLEDGRLISDEIEGEALDLFLSISGYELDEDPDEKAPPASPAEPPAPKLTKAQQKAAEKAAAEAAEKAAAAQTPAPEPVTLAAETTTNTEDDAVF